MMKNYFLILCSFSVLFFGCVEKPKSVGNGLPNTDGVFTIQETSFYSTKDTTYKTTYPLGFSASSFAGRISSTEELISLVKFSTGSVLDSLRGAKIDTAELQLTVYYRYFPKTPPVSFNVFEVKSAWSQSTFSSDSLATLMLGTKAIGVFSDSMNFLAVASARIDTAEIRKWANTYLDSSALPYHGFAIQAPPSVTTGAVGFSSFNNYTDLLPRLVIRYTKNARRDSLIFSSGEDTYAARYTGPSTFTPMTLRGGFAVRSKVHFNVSSLADKPIINNATLELTLDSASSSLSGNSPDSVLALLGMSDAIVDRADSTIFAFGIRKARQAGKPPVYTFNLTAITDRWVRAVNPNFGINLLWGAEYYTVEKAVFFNSANTDTTKRPILKVIYSKK